jgi:hypothetical protein
VVPRNGANLTNLRRRELRAAIPFTGRLTLALKHVLHVVELAAR